MLQAIWIWTAYLTLSGTLRGGPGVPPMVPDRMHRDAPRMTMTLERPVVVPAATASPATGWALLALTVISVPSALALDRSPGPFTEILVALGFVMVAALDLVVGWGLARLTADSPRLALASMVTRGAYAAWLAMAAIGLLLWPGFDTTDFNDWWQPALALFGVHLIVTGAALLATRVGPRWLAILVGLGGMAYVLDAPPLHGLVSSSALLPFMFGEVLLLGWLLWTGRRRR